MPETVLVTGGTGFVGGWCIADLLKRGYAVRTTIRDLGKEEAVRAAITGVADPDDRLAILRADLTAEAGWDAALDGCDYALHVASPLASKTRDPNDLIAPARDGTLRVLRAALKARVRRIVVTSSGAACCPPLNSPDSETDETFWTDVKDRGLTPYRKSKAVSERAAWDFMMQQGAGGTLAAVLPAGVFGPVLTTDGIGSVGLVLRLLSGAMPGIPRLGFNVIDVRDLADLHIRAMLAPEAAGQRFVAAGEFLWMEDVAKILRDRLGDAAKRVPTRLLPNIVLRAGALFDAGLRDIAPMLGHRHSYSSAKAQRVLGWKPRPAAQTIVDCASSLIEKGAVRV